MRKIINFHFKGNKRDIKTVDKYVAKGKTETIFSYIYKGYP